MTQQIGAAGAGMSASHLQNMGLPPSMDREFMMARGMMRERISQYIQGHQLTSRWLQRIPDIAKRMDDYLYKHASSKEDYMNLETLENRLQSLIKGLYNQQSMVRRVSSSAQMSTMIPTPGMSHGGSTNVTASCSTDNSMVSINNSGALMAAHVGTGTVLQTSNRAASVEQGLVTDGYRQSSVNSSIGTISLNGLSHSSSQMIPTPGLNNAQSMPVNSGDSGLGYSSIESTVSSQQPLQKQFIGNQTSRILQNLGGQLGVGLRSNMQQRYGLSNGSLTYMGNNQQLMNESAVSKGYLSSPSYSNTSKPLHQQHHQLLRPRDGYGMNNITGDGSLHNSTNPAGLTITSSNIDSLSRSKTSTTPQSYQPNLPQIQQTAQKPLVDHSEKMEFQSPHVVQENLLQNPQQFPNFHHRQSQQQTGQPYAQFVQHQFQTQQQFVENGPFRQPLLPSALSGQLRHDQSIEAINESLLPRTVEEFQLPELPGYQQNNMADNNPMDTKPVTFQKKILQSSISHDPRQMHRMFDPAQQNVESQNNFSSLSDGCQPEAQVQGEWHTQTPEKPHVLDQTLLQHHNHSNFQQQLIMQDDGQQLHFPLEEELGTVSGVVNGMGVPKSSDLVPCDNGNVLRAIQYRNQQRWLLFLGHARHCSAPRGKCLEENCTTVQDLWLHMMKCNTDDCTYPRCKKSKALLKHYRSCQAADCPVCVPVRNYIASKYKARPPLNSNCANEINGSRRTVDAADGDKPVSKTSLSSIETSELQTSKRMKVEHVSSKSEIYSRSPVQAHPLGDSGFPVNREVTTVKVEPAIIGGVNNPPDYLRRGNNDDLENTLIVSGECQVKPEAMQVDKDFNQPKFDIKQEAGAPVDPVSGTKSGKPKIKGVSLTELFTPEQVREHILGLRQWVGQSKAKAEKNQAMEHSMSENSCQLCAVEKLTFDPPPIYCSICGARIKRNAMYYACGSNDTRNYLCIPCHNDARGDTVEVEGSVISKAKFEKKKNDEETEEWWVQCDKCEAWQHQICALFNGRRNEGGQAEYTCPNCYVQEVERGERKPLPQSTVLGADDLPKTLLSDHLEQRLFRRLKLERQDRARIMGKSFDEVPGAEGLVIRVVSSVDKKLDVKPRFLEIFQEDNYPTEFPYKSKVVLLFQKIEGVEVCLFGMYVQEFGSECQFPNQRRVYLSYLDSVKYFRPEIKAMTGEALRTFVYHEILIGYLEYCKKRGFTSCYIWACPPLKGEDYILYCHPEIQKTPKSDKLREWYLQMLRKAMKENIVVDLTNLYDHFFITMGECKAKVTAARLPYFDGDYWPGAAEDMINLLQQEEDGRKQQKKGKTKKTITKRALKAAGHTDLSGNASKDALLMQKLGETISPMKEDFIMVHLQHACNHCCLLMVSGIRWVCNQCKNFQLCERCYDAELKREERDRHPMGSRDTHSLNKIAITDVPSDTKDKDDIVESEFFDTRQAFLSLCQGNHYQYDTLRHAKHSSMMVLYHLHNPTAPAFVTTCNVCQHDIEAGQGWHCEICPDFDVCNNCYRKDDGVDHPHELTNHPSMVDAQNTEARQKRVVELRKMLNLLVHASQCRVPPNQPLQCQYPDCRKVKGLFRHGRACKVRASGGCLLCKRMWHLLQLHARACKESECHVPRCRDLKDHLRRLQQQSESRRRAAVNEMMRQRAVEVSGSS